jgi:hypothetical protein
MSEQIQEAGSSLHETFHAGQKAAVVTERKVSRER